MTTLLALDVKLQKFLEPSDSGCIEWKGSTRRGGYGRITIQGSREISTHRLAWIIAHGDIPEGLCVLHKCDNPSCCNTEHLFLGTKAENNLDRDRKGRQWQQKKTQCPYGHLYDAENTITNKVGHRICKTCSHIRDKKRRLRNKMLREVLA